MPDTRVHHTTPVRPLTVPLEDLILRGEPPEEWLTASLAVEIAVHGLRRPIRVRALGNCYEVATGSTIIYAIAYLIDHGTTVWDSARKTFGDAHSIYNTLTVLEETDA